MNHKVQTVHYNTVNSLCIATTSLKRPPRVSNHFTNNPFVSQSALFQKLSHKRPLPKFPKRPQPLFGPEIWYILLFCVSGKQPPGMITYDCKKTIAQMSQKLIFE